MYIKQGSHSLCCGNVDILYDELKCSEILSVSQLPLMDGGFFSKVLGVKYSELVFEGGFIPSDKLRFEAFIGIVRAATVDLTADGVNYNGCTMVEYELSRKSDSDLYKYRIKFRRY